MVNSYFSNSSSGGADLPSMLFVVSVTIICAVALPVFRVFLSGSSQENSSAKSHLERLQDNRNRIEEFLSRNGLTLRELYLNLELAEQGFGFDERYRAYCESPFQKPLREIVRLSSCNCLAEATSNVGGYFQALERAFELMNEMPNQDLESPARKLLGLLFFLNRDLFVLAGRVDLANSISLRFKLVSLIGPAPAA